MQSRIEARDSPVGLAQSERATGVRWRIFGVVFLITLINLVDRISLSIAMPTIAKEFALSPAMQGLILSSFFWSYALLQIPGGWLIDRFGPRRVVAAATLLWGMFQTLLGVASGGLSMLFLRVGLGGAEAPLFPAGSKLNALWLSRHERARGAVLMDAGSPLGAAIGGLAISNLILVFGSWRMAFIVAGLVTIGCGWLAWHYLRDDPAKHPGVNVAELEHIGGGAVPLARAAFTAADEPPFPVRSAVAMCVGRLSWAMIFFGLLTWGPSYLARARGLSLQQIGTSTFFIFLSGALGSLSGGFLCDALCSRGWTRQGSEEHDRVVGPDDPGCACRAPFDLVGVGGRGRVVRGGIFSDVGQPLLEPAVAARKSSARRSARCDDELRGERRRYFDSAGHRLHPGDYRLVRHRPAVL
jgi:ACS family D-galactonate transporter-like MFS transporter